MSAIWPRSRGALRALVDIFVTGAVALGIQVDSTAAVDCPNCEALQATCDSCCESPFAEA